MNKKGKSNMAKQEQLALLKQGVEAWNLWRKGHPDKKINLSEAEVRWAKNLMGIDLREADLHESYLIGINMSSANLSKANLSGAHLSEMDLSKANLAETNLSRAYLHEVRLVGATLDKANLIEATIDESNLLGVDMAEASLYMAHLLDTRLSVADLSGADLRKAVLIMSNLDAARLQETDLTGADLTGVFLVRTDLTNATLTGAKLYGTARNDWNIEGIRCDYIFWDAKPDFYGADAKENEQQWEAEHRFPKDRDFRPGEFESLYKQFPTFEYYFQHGLTPIDAILMDQVVQTIDQRYPEFQLKLVSLDSRGQPHAVFTILQQEQVEPAKSQVTLDYEKRIAALEGKHEQMWELITNIVNHPQIIHQYNLSGGMFMNATKQIIGNNFESGGGSQNNALDQATANQTNYTVTQSSSVAELLQLLSAIQQDIATLPVTEQAKAEALNEVKGAEIQAQKPTPDKPKIAARLKNAGAVLKAGGALGAKAVAVGNMLGKAILWCGEHWTF